jgi:lipoprotein-releasing system permease protein
VPSNEISLRARTAGTLAELSRGEPPAITLGDALARLLKIKVGDALSLALASGDGTAHTFRVTGLFHSGFAVYDEELAYTSLAAGQNLIDRGDQMTGVEVKLADIAQSAAVARSLEQTLGAPYQVMDWYELNHALFTTLFGERRP